MTQPIILTGDRPTGCLHLGHYVGSLLNRVKLQQEYKQYIMIADLQALTDHAEEPNKIFHYVVEVAKDYLSVGIDPNLTTILIQSKITELSELTIYLMNLISVSRLSRNPTVKNEIAQKGYTNHIPVGFFCYPISQAADILAFKATIIPVGEDQLPMIELSNEVARKFNSTYNSSCLLESKALLSKSSRLIGTDGQNKASKSLQNTIFLSDSIDIIKSKVFSMYTDPNHIHSSDPGNVQGNVVFSYLDAFYHDEEELQALKSHYERGGLGDMMIKNILFNTLVKLLSPIQEKRSTLKTCDITEMLMVGTADAQKHVRQTMMEVRDAIGLSYW